jgi:RimJ/RimL family protein N-acetyltransferase
MSQDLATWTGVPRPDRVTLEGRYARLEPLDAARHGKELLASALEPGAGARFRYLFDAPPQNAADMTAWLDKAAASPDPMFFAVIDKASGTVHGRQSLMRIDPVHGAIEIGNILWGPGIARSRVATEALYLFAKYVFEDLGYRRFEWKCDSQNAPSRRAALRFGFSFEGIFRQHMVVKGQNRDTAWFAMTSDEWPGLKARFEAWLDPENFDSGGVQKRKLNVAL